MARVRASASLIAWLAALTAVIAVFTALGDGALAGPARGDPATWGDWVRQRDAATAAVAALRLVVLALAWYLAGVTGIGLVARLSRATRVVAVSDAVTVPVVRRALQAALGVSLAATVVASSAVVGPTTRAAAAETSPMVPIEHLSTPVAGQGEGSGAERPVALGPPGASGARRTSSDAGLPPLGDRRSEHRVVPGEHLWSIAHAHLSADGRAPTDVEVAAHWQHVVDLNRDRLADPAEPDLIFPGQRFVLPPLPALSGGGVR